MVARRSVLLVVLVLVVVLGVVACGGRGGVSISISPVEVVLAPGESVEFTATVRGARDGLVEWSASGGELVASGSTAVFTAPAEVGEYSVTARSARDRGRWASAVVRVAWPVGGGVASLVVGPGAVTLVALGDEAALEVRAFDASGAAVSLDGYVVEWRMSESAAVELVVDSEDPTRARVRAAGALGSAVVSAALVGGEVLSSPVGVSVASVLPGVGLVRDAAVVFPFVDVPPGADPASFAPPGYGVVGGVPSVAGFVEDEIVALLAVEGATLLYPVVLIGEAPVVGEVLLGTGGSAVMGRVRSVESRGGAHLAQVAQVGLDEVFEDFVFSFDSVALESQGVLTQSSWRGLGSAAPVEASGLVPIPIAGCEFEGGLTAVGITASVSSSLDPIMELDVDLGAGKMRLVVGVRGGITGEVGVDLQGGVAGAVSCNAGVRRNLTMPLPAGPLASLLSGGAQFQPKFKVAVEASAGPRFGVSGSVGFHPELQAGFDIRDGRIDNLSGVRGEPTSDVSLIADLGFGDMNFGVTPGYYFEGDIGIQLGGWTLEKICGWATSWIPGVGAICDDVMDALFLEAVQGSLGVELQTVWDSPRRVLNQGESESRMLLAAVTTAALRNDALNTVLERFRFAPVELELFSHQLRGPTLYRVFRPAAMEITAPSMTGPVFQGQVVEVEVGDSVHFRVTGERESAFLPMRDTPLHAGEVWVGAGKPVAGAAVSVTGDDSLSIDLLVSAELCTEAVDGLVPLHFLGYNRMLDLVATAGYLGHVRLDCGAGDPSEVVVTIEPEAVTLAVSETVSFAAEVDGASDTSVTWDAAPCGSIAGSGNTVTYTAPPSVPTGGTCRVRATSVADVRSWAEATVTVVPAAGNVFVGVDNVDGVPAEGVTVTLSGAGGTFSSVSDGAGVAEFHGVPEGEYIAEVWRLFDEVGQYPLRDEYWGSTSVTVVALSSTSPLFTRNMPYMTDGLDFPPTVEVDTSVGVSTNVVNPASMTVRPRLLLDRTDCTPAGCGTTGVTGASTSGAGVSVSVTPTGTGDYRFYLALETNVGGEWRVTDQLDGFSFPFEVTDPGGAFEPAPSYISISNVSLGAASGGTRQVGFDISWGESWRGPDRPTWVEASDNWDAAWVFVKYRESGGAWQHATLAASGHVQPPGSAVSVPSDRVGAFVYRSSSGYGTFTANGVGLQWDYMADGVSAGASVEVVPFGIEMVFVPQGAFSLGSGGSCQAPHGLDFPPRVASWH